MRPEFGQRYSHPQNVKIEEWCTSLPGQYADYEEVLPCYQLLWSTLDPEDSELQYSLGHKSASIRGIAKEELLRRYMGLAFLGCNDRFFLLTRLCGRKDANHPWLYERCREVERNPDGYIDLWSRFHYKSTIITFAGAIQEVVRNPEIKIAIFSVVKPIAQAFLSQIKEEFENNDLLKRVYPDVLYQAPRTVGQDGRPAKWGLARGITVKRQSNPKEATIEAHGLIDGQPTSRHFDLHIYDDMVTQDYLSEEAIRKTT